MLNAQIIPIFPAYEGEVREAEGQVPHQTTFCLVDDAAESFVVGVVVAPDDVPADHAGLFFVAGVVGVVSGAPGGPAEPLAAGQAAFVLSDLSVTVTAHVTRRAPPNSMLKGRGLLHPGPSIVRRLPVAAGRIVSRRPVVLVFRSFGGCGVGVRVDLGV